jgi:histone-lysine N-methyltransferase SETMAR
MRKVTSRWVPRQLNDEQKQERVRFCRENLVKFRSGSWRLCDVITGDEIWIYHRQIGHKSTNKRWVGEGESPTNMARRSKFESKNLFSIFFKSNGPVLIHCVDEGKTTDHNYYIENCLKPVIKEIWKQRKSSGTNGIKLLHDNARPHTHSDVIDYLTQEGINIMPHPLYSPDLAPCDYWLNDYIKRNLIDQANEKSLARAIIKIVKNIPEEEFKKTFDKLLVLARLSS